MINKIISEISEASLEPMSLPWPPSANRYWRNVKGKTLVSKEAKDYKRVVKALSFTWKRKPILGRVEINISAYPPNKRRRDIDNLLKITIDSLKDCGIFKDDSQIDKIFIERKNVIKPGLLTLSISEIESEKND